MIIADVECYSNYWLLAMTKLETGKIRHFELYDEAKLDIETIKKLLKSDTIITFNGNNYDLPLISAALFGYNNQKLKALSDSIIGSKLPSWQILKNHPFQIIKIDHIDLIEVAPGKSSLKLYAGRLHATTLQDLPIEPTASIPPNMRETLRNYCENDLALTALLYNTLKPQIDLRVTMSAQYGMDLRSKSDAQIAETIITSELKKMTGKEYKKPQIPDGQTFRYIDPEIVSFVTPELEAIKQRLMAEEFTLGANGAVTMPTWLQNTKIKIGQTEYQMGIGGLHSCEKSQYVNADDSHSLTDWDVASYYPSIILQQHLAPKSMGAEFLKVYQDIVSKRLEAKQAGDKVTADVLKIAVNGSYGKLGSKYSPLYAPELLIQTTITGQLCLLMLIERVEAVGAHVVSANTDGIVIYCLKSLEPAVASAAFDWMLDTSFELEKTEYKTLASRDVNNYVAVKLDGKTKGKGVFTAASLAKNPDESIIPFAVMQYLAKGTPLEQTIQESRDITKFVTVRRVTGGATWRGEKLGKTVRFYHATSIPSDVCIHYATNTNRVPNSAGCKPLMQLPDAFPDDVDYHYYSTEAGKLLCEVGCA